jgi:ADP-ribosyl-[dinitrogen reductase] hydrolase
MARFADWADDGDYNCTGSCFDIGNTVNAAVARYRRTGNPVAGDDHPMSAGNGSLMRLAPVAARWFRDRATLRDVAARQSRVTHAAAEAVDACVAYAELLADAIEGRDVLGSRETAFAPKVAAVLGGSWRGAERGSVRGSGYVVDALEAALWAVGRGGDYRHTVLAAANLGEDADTTAAIAGQLAGALDGAGGIPAGWLAKLVWRERIETAAGALADAALAEA